jgi:hypothetical protein
VPGKQVIHNYYITVIIPFQGLPSLSVHSLMMNASVPKELVELARL